MSDDHAQDIKDLTEEINRLQEGFNTACRNITALTERRAALKDALNTSCLLIDQLINELRANGIQPSIALQVAKKNFDDSMKRLLGLERTQIEKWPPPQPKAN